MQTRPRALHALLLCLVVAGSSAQPISPSAFIVAGGAAPPPPPPPPASDFSLGFDGATPNPPTSAPGVTSSPPPATASPPPPAQAQGNSTAASNNGSSHSSGSSISGGAIAGIVVGALAGVAIVAAVAFFALRRRQRQRMATLPSSMEAGDPPRKEGDGDVISDLPAKSPKDGAGGDMYMESGPLAGGYGLSWREGDDLKSVKGEHASIKTAQGGALPESLADVPRVTGSTDSGRPPLSKSSVSDSVVQVMPDNTVVVLSRGPGGSIKVSRGNNSVPLSTGSTNSQAISIRSADSGATGSSGTGSRLSGSVDLPSLPWSDWEIKAEDIIISKDENGQPAKLGAGAYGTVYRATIDGVQEVAVKVFHDVHNTMQQADILREVAILKSCRDRNIVQFLGACIMDERIMLVTELMEAGDLWHALVTFQSSGALSWYRRGRRIALEVARGLHFLHRHRIIHFDLKSANVLLTRDGTAKISDVGFANILSNTHLSNGMNAFTFAWAAPEVLMGGACSDKVDIFSYGVLLWEIVTGQQPRRGQLRECRVPEECPKEVEDLIQSCLDFDSEKRPTCKDIVEVLNKLQDDPPPPGAVATPPASANTPVSS